MTDTEKGLLAEVLANPADDLVREAYADWLQENSGAEEECPRCEGYGRYAPADAHGDNIDCHKCLETGMVTDGRADRAEFIRVQIELARHLAAPGKNSRDFKRYGHLRERERELWASLARVYRREIPDGFNVILPSGGTGGYDRHLVVVRGFLGEFRGPLSWWIGGLCNRCIDWMGRDRVGPRGVLQPPHCPACQTSTGVVRAMGASLVKQFPLTYALATDCPVWHSGGNSTYYLGGLGRFPRKYWGKLDQNPTEKGVLDAASEALLEIARG